MILVNHNITTNIPKEKQDINVKLVSPVAQSVEQAVSELNRESVKKQKTKNVCIRRTRVLINALAHW